MQTTILVIEANEDAAVAAVERLLAAAPEEIDLDYSIEDVHRDYSISSSTSLPFNEEQEEPTGSYRRAYTPPEEDE